MHTSSRLKQWSWLSLSILALASNLHAAPTLEGRASDSDIQSLVQSITWDDDTFKPQILGSRAVTETTAIKSKQLPRSIAFLANGDLLGAYGGGTAPHMGMVKWSGRVESDFVKFEYRRYENAAKDPQRSDDETHGIFWFFDGILAINSKDQVYFNLGSGSPNGIYRLLETDPIKIEKETPTDTASALQFFPADSSELYMTNRNVIRKAGPGQPGDAGLAPKFAINADDVLTQHFIRVLIAHSLIIDKDHILATLVLGPDHRPSPEEMHNLHYKTAAVLFDRKRKGYYIYNLDDWGAMAIRPSDLAIFRCDIPSHEIRQVTLNLDSPSE